MSQLNLLGLGLMILFLALQYFIIRHQLGVLEESERKIDFARSIQVEGQQIAFQSQLLLKGNEEVGSEMAARLESIDHKLVTLKNGGRISGSLYFITPLSRLSRITYDNLEGTWINYRAAINRLIFKDSEQIVTDSTAALPVAKFTSTSGVLQEAKWLSFSDWFDKLIVDLEDEAKVNQASVIRWTGGLFVTDILLIALLAYGFQVSVLRPVLELKKNISSHTPSPVTSTEIGQVSAGVNSIIDELKEATDFVGAIGEGKLDVTLTTSIDAQKSLSSNNKLAHSLMLMQEKLRTMNETEKRRQWANEGLTRFVEIMRSANDNLHTLGDAVIAALVQYTNSNQGGLYILNDEDPNNKFLELVSLFAFDTKKYQEQKIRLGEGLLGQTFLEKETTHLTNMPEEYIRITSGLGDASPKALLLLPLKVDTEAYGIIELASFREYHQHEIDFVEKLGESIAATLASVRSAQKNRQLIEQFQQQTEEMRAQEEEMRQNMEEMQATQEEIARKENAYLERIRELETKLKYSDTSPDHESARLLWETKESELTLRINELTEQISRLSTRPDDWAVAEQLGETLKMNIEALRITQQEQGNTGKQ